MKLRAAIAASTVTSVPSFAESHRSIAPGAAVLLSSAKKIPFARPAGWRGRNKRSAIGAA